MAKSLIENGYCIVKKAWLSKKLEAIGVGQTKPDAWRDAAEKMTQGRLDAREMIVKNPDMKCVPCKIAVTFDPPEGL